MQPIIKIENLSKQYRLGLIGTGTLSNDLKRWWYRSRGKEDPFLKIGETNERSVKGDSDYVWALKDINLEVMPGEILGIIGKNGAGKSTLLKILSKVTGPTKGSISFNGRIGALLEVGTGFHPELTGRENIFLNGAILGMTKVEIRSKLDEIIDFSGVERYINTPVKRYSSGMMVRLGFAVAAHLEPEILVVDEVLAVGDADFQKKAIGKMEDISKVDGRTVLFVSHNMESISRLCNRCILLSDGTINLDGSTTEIINKYLLNYSNFKTEFNFESSKFLSFVNSLYMTDHTGRKMINFSFDDELFIHISAYIGYEDHTNYRISFAILSLTSVVVLSTSFNDFNDVQLIHGYNRFRVKIPKALLNTGDYVVRLFFDDIKTNMNIQREDCFQFKINEKGVYPNASKRKALIIPQLEWAIEKD